LYAAIFFVLGGAYLLVSYLRRRREASAQPAVVLRTAPRNIKPMAPPPPVARPAVEPPAPPTIATAPEAPIRERLRSLPRGMLTPELARRAQLVEAYLDINRIDSAEKLLGELEKDCAELHTQPPGLTGTSD
jgi:hypothetical protein